MPNLKVILRIFGGLGGLVLALNDAVTAKKGGVRILYCLAKCDNSALNQRRRDSRLICAPYICRQLT